MKTPSVFSLSLAVVTHCSSAEGRQKGKETGEKARRGPAHLAIDLQAIKGNLHRRGHTDTDSRMDPGISNLEF
ncbi:hypothetical protein JOQ06_012666 [Pogonophryne albipinna]|uniref:Uncharacterized protein n=1 Tax=Pogonophryne albipinna TaxID=1090488 RepID=A0AAD6FSQ6_9TELE|nr:hypothetical protein JOQ06_012666 [Pogonophryne albipinna]